MRAEKYRDEEGILEDSELIVREDGSIYHLQLCPEQIADNIIVVGDQNRVKMISDRFDSIEHKVNGREFFTHTGYLNGKRLSVLSTGIGVDNIDIVLNELDALVNIDLQTKEIKKEKRSLNIIRIGTSGSLQKSIPTGTFLVSQFAIGFDGVLNFYQNSPNQREKDLLEAFHEQIDYPEILPKPYIVESDPALFGLLSKGNTTGMTATASGFYGPQGRILRLLPQFGGQNQILAQFEHEGIQITNFEMETSNLYGLSALLGHKACTVCAIIANRSRGEFSKQPLNEISEMIDMVLQRLTS